MQITNTANPRMPTAIYSANSGVHATWVGIYPCICGVGRCDGAAVADEPARERGCTPSIQAAF